jgi:hypothetical protein
MESLESTTNEPPSTTKPKRQLSESQLAQLAKAREKANAVRKRNAEQRQSQKQKAQQLKDLKRQAQEKEVDAELSKLTLASKSVHSVARKAEPPLELESSESESESESSSSEEEQAPPPRRRRVNRTKRKVKRRPVSSESDTSDEEYVPDKKKWSHQTAQDSMYDRQMQRAFASLFPNTYV